MVSVSFNRSARPGDFDGVGIAGARPHGVRGRPANCHDVIFGELGRNQSGSTNGTMQKLIQNRSTVPELQSDCPFGGRQASGVTRGPPEAAG